MLTSAESLELSTILMQFFYKSYDMMREENLLNKVEFKNRELASLLFILCEEKNILS